MRRQASTPAKRQAAFSLPVPKPSTLLQRKCACGGTPGVDGECAACRAKRLQQLTWLAESSLSEPMSHRMLSGITKPRFGHHFAQVSINARSARPITLPGCAARLFQGKNGETGCDVSVGTPSTTMHDPPACYRACVERHEAVHAADLAPCCKKANKAHAAAKSDEAKTQVQEKFNQWVLNNVDWLECRGYAESARCAKQFVEQHCEAKQNEEIPEASSNEMNNETSDEEQSKLISLDVGDLEPEQEPEVELAEEKTEGNVEPPAPAPRLCCSQVKTYRRISEGRRDTVCDRAKKSLSACPF